MSFQINTMSHPRGWRIKLRDDPAFSFSYAPFLWETLLRGNLRLRISKLRLTLPRCDSNTPKLLLMAP